MMYLMISKEIYEDASRNVSSVYNVEYEYLSYTSR
jgi:hypothetical protein